MKWACNVYHVSERETPLEQTRIRNALQSISSALNKRKKGLQDKATNEDAPPPPAKKANKNNGSDQSSKRKNGKTPMKPSNQPFCMSKPSATQSFSGLQS